MILKQRAIAQPGDEAWVVLPLESEQRCDVQMIVVVVTQEHDIDWRKVFEAQAWSAMSPWTSPRKRTRMIRPDWIGQDVQAAGLNQHRGVVDKRYP